MDICVKQYMNKMVKIGRKRNIKVKYIGAEILIMYYNITRRCIECM